MTTSAGRSGGALEERRVPFNERVEVKFKLFQEFVSELSANLSLGGMFLETRLARQPGEQFEFQIRLEDDFALIEGTGEVAWRRDEDEGPARPAGLGVRFVTLTAESHQLIRRIVEEHEKGGGRPFDLAREAPPTSPGEPEPAAEAPPGPVAAEAPPAPPASLGPPVEVGSAAPGPPPSPSRAVPAATPAGAAVEPHPKAKRPPPDGSVAVPAAGRAAADSSRGGGWTARALRLGALAVVSAAIGGLAVWLGHRILVQPQLDALARQVDELSHAARARAEAARPPRAAPGSGSQSGGAEATGSEGPGAAVTAPQSLPAAARPLAIGAGGDPTETVRAWARAWSEKRFDDYLASYSRRFRPPDGLSRAAWEAQRRSRILRPGPISVTVAAMEAGETEGGNVLVRCTQAYRSARYSDIVRKAILLTREEGAWRILEERVER